MRMLKGILAAVSLVTFCCVSACAPASLAVHGSEPAPPLAVAHAAGLAPGICAYLDSAVEATRGADWRVRVTVVNKGSAPRHFDDYGKGVWLVEKGVPIVVRVQGIPIQARAGDIILQRSLQPLDLAPGASVVETLTISADVTRELAPGYHTVHGTVSLGTVHTPDQQSAEIDLRMRVLFR